MFVVAHIFSYCMRIRFCICSKSASQTGSAVNERQEITMTSAVMPETQTLNISGLPEVVQAEYEVQVVAIVPATEDYVSEYRLGLHGVYSGINVYTECVT